MKTKLLAALFLTGTFAFPATVVTDTIRTFDGSAFTGSIVITAPRMTTLGGATIAAWQKTYAVSNGAFSASFEPNDTATPSGTSYAVQYRPSQGSAYSEFWIIPTSGSPVTIAAIAVSNAVTPSLTLLLAQLSGVGVSKGSILAFGTAWGALAPGTNTYVLTADSTQARGVKWAANSGGGGAGTWGSITGTLTDQTDLAAALAARVAGGATNSLQVNGGSGAFAGRGSLDSSGYLAVAGGVSSGTAGTYSGAKQFLGLTSGSAGFAAKDIAGSSILYLLPSVAGSTNQVLSDTGATTCPTLDPGVGSVACHALLWVDQTGGGGGTDGAWIACPTLQGGWANYGGAEQVCEYMKDRTGRVYLRGTMAPGTESAGFTVTTLPAGFRPLANQLFMVMAGGNGSIPINMNAITTGEIQYNSTAAGAASGLVSFAGMSWQTN